MLHYLEMPEALNFIAGQAWLSPSEPVRAARLSPTLHRQPRTGRLGWSEALREILAILRRVGRG